jgi:hypothetical protein
MKLSFLGACLAFAALVLPVAGLGLADVRYPVYLAYDQSDPQIAQRWLPFATRSAHPEYIGAALSAAHVVPSDDSAKLPKDINLIHVCGIKITTGQAAGAAAAGGKVPVALEIDLRGLNRPEHVPHDVAAVVAATGEAIAATLEKKGCRIATLAIQATAEQASYRAALEERLKPGAGGGE